MYHPITFSFSLKTTWILPSFCFGMHLFESHGVDVLYINSLLCFHVVFVDWRNFVKGYTPHDSHDFPHSLSAWFTMGLCRTCVGNTHVRPSLDIHEFDICMFFFSWCLAQHQNFNYACKHEFQSSLIFFPFLFVMDMYACVMFNIVI